MPSPIEVLPSELFLHVVEYLRHHDLATLMRVSRPFNDLIEPVLWTRIEFHRKYFHEDYAMKPFRQEEEALQRPYFEPGFSFSPAPGNRHEGRSRYNAQSLDGNGHKNATIFLNQFSNEKFKDEERTAHLTGIVRWLCLPVNRLNSSYSNDLTQEKAPGVWDPLVKFSNLEYLEISSFWRPQFLHRMLAPPPFRQVSHKMQRLRTLKLRGYFPIEFLQYVLQSAPTITELQLAVLDRPIGSDNFSPGRNPPDSPPDGYDYMDEEEQEKMFPGFEDLRQDSVAARAFPCLSPEIMAQLTALTRLHLCRPSQAFGDDDYIYNSVKSDEIILDEWASLLRATRETLEHITLEQRPVGGESEPDGTDNREFMSMACNGPGYMRFVEKVLPVLLEADWPALKTLHLVGFEYGSYATHRSKRFHRSVHIDMQLESRFPKIRVISSLGRRILVESETGEIMDGGDVLDTCNSFSENEDDDPI